MEAAGLGPDTCVVDIGGGDSRLVDNLAARGMDCLAVLDVSAAALHRAQSRVGPAASALTWIEADVTGGWSLEPMDIWHDRAVFHFLTAPEDRRRYLARLHATLKPQGTAILATFDLDGPEKCSGLQIRKYSEEVLTSVVQTAFHKLKCIREDHITPFQTVQNFLFCSFQKKNAVLR